MVVAERAFDLISLLSVNVNPITATRALDRNFVKNYSREHTVAVRKPS